MNNYIIYRESLNKPRPPQLAEMEEGGEVYMQQAGNYYDTNNHYFMQNPGANFSGYTTPENQNNYTFQSPTLQPVPPQYMKNYAEETNFAPSGLQFNPYSVDTNYKTSNVMDKKVNPLSASVGSGYQTNAYGEQRFQKPSANYEEEIINIPQKDTDTPEQPVGQYAWLSQYEEDKKKGLWDNNRQPTPQQQPQPNYFGGNDNVSLGLRTLGQGIGEKDGWKTARGAGLTAIAGARSYLGGYGAGKEARRVEDEYRNELFKDNRQSIAMQEGGEIDQLKGKKIISYSLNNNTNMYDVVYE